MKNITLELSNVHLHGAAFFDYLALRKQFFVDTLHWQIPHNASVEMDQYDNPMARYSLVLDDNGRVLTTQQAARETATRKSTRKGLLFGLGTLGAAGLMFVLLRRRRALTRAA